MTKLPDVTAVVDEKYIEGKAKKAAQDLLRLGLLCLMYTGESPEDEEDLGPGLPVSSRTVRTWSPSQRKVALMLALEEIQKHL